MPSIGPETSWWPGTYDHASGERVAGVGEPIVPGHPEDDEEAERGDGGQRAQPAPGRQGGDTLATPDDPSRPSGRVAVEP